MNNSVEPPAKRAFSTVLLAGNFVLKHSPYSSLVKCLFGGTIVPADALGVNMVNLALYSDQVIPENFAIDLRLLELVKATRAGVRIGYVPSGPEPEQRFFRERKSYYAQCGFDLSLFYDLNEPHSSRDLAELFGCDAIHLSGGHTGNFLQQLKISGMFNPLRNWALRGGVLIGASAGAILMTPTIAVDALFSGEKPENVMGGNALNLLPFEFFPHLNTQENYLPELIRYSANTAWPIVAVNDGDGIVVSGGLVECIGDPVWIFEGTIKKANEIRLLGLSILQSS